MYKLNLRDYKILAELDKNCKASYNQIGRKLRLSPSVVERRVKNLIKKEIILGFKTIINYKKLRWTYYSVYARFQNADESKKNEILKYLKEHPLSGQVLLCDGRLNFIFGFFAKDVFELMQELKKFDNLFGDYVSKTDKIIHTGSHHYYRGYLLGKEIFRDNEPYLGGPESAIKLDKEGYELLNEIRDNARINIVSLSGKLGISVDKIRYRIKNLTRDKIIMGSWLHLNSKTLGLQFYRVLLNTKNMDEKKEKEFLEFLNNHKNVIRANRVFGSWDYFTDLEITPESFREFMDVFTKNFSGQIQEYETLMIYDEAKYVFNPLF